MQWWQQPFFQVTIPMILAIAIVTWRQNKAIHGIHRKIDDFRADMHMSFDSLEAHSDGIEAVRKRSWR